ncbi:glucans biosynthesis glucosyltransferase MdoH [Sphingomonas sp. MJ1 (PH-R8)]|uniref:glucans biosynthesis glucosyltransferase MdoH n=1 Tax=Sphingomonas sp. MJ1 (PH-R8) TaxID=3112950 RepID=UPI003A8B9B57
MKQPARLPAEAPIDMPVQQFDGPPPPRRIPEPWSGPSEDGGDLLARRVLLVLLTAMLATAASTALKESLVADGWSVTDALLLVIFFPLFALISFGFINASIGFLLLITGLRPGFMPTPRWSAPLKGRTAILMPVHNEDVAAVYGRIAQMAEAIAQGGMAKHFDFFILSDSAPEAEAEEVAAWRALAQQLDCALYYRRRTQNVGRKPGNVAEWIRRFGGAYDYMLMLDADSLMGGDTIIGMAQVLDRRPAVALLQTVPMVIGATTLFQRWMQFASHLYGPISTAGLVWWSGSEATFWGHNALIRIEAFAACCGLPELPGGPPFGGTIMSHDMVEAALLRRRGWRVHMVLTDATFEEYPPTLIDAAVRDRRWAQGNIQHLRLLGASGFHWINRLQLLLGASAYLASPLWLLLILTSIVQALVGEPSLMNRGTSAVVLAVTLLLLFGPKLLSVIWATADRERREALGGWRTIGLSVLLDVPLSMLVAPAIALTQTIDLVGIAAGKRSAWDPQSRQRDGLAMRDILPRYRWHLGFGMVLLLLSPLMPVTALWLLPVTLGLLLSPLAVQWTASARAGAWAARHAIFEPRYGQLRTAPLPEQRVGPAPTPV